MVHTYDVNQPITDTQGGHCTSDAWDGGHCLMNSQRTKAERGDGKVSLHNDPWQSSEYRRIRRRGEPNPLEDQPALDPNP